MWGIFCTKKQVEKQIIALLNIQTVQSLFQTPTLILKSFPFFQMTHRQCISGNTFTIIIKFIKRTETTKKQKKKTLITTILTTMCDCIYNVDLFLDPLSHFLPPHGHHAGPSGLSRVLFSLPFCFLNGKTKQNKIK